MAYQGTVHHLLTKFTLLVLPAPAGRCRMPILVQKKDTVLVPIIILTNVDVVTGLDT
jgi:hypothetical protein